MRHLTKAQWCWIWATILGLVALVSAIQLAWGLPVTWEWAYRERFIGKAVTSKADVIGRFEECARHQPRQVAVLVTETLAGTAAGRTALRNMCAKMDNYVLARCGQQLPVGDRTVLKAAAPGIDATPENVLAGSVADATAPMP